MQRIIAIQISNLTDARYFAAQGVDYLLFDSSLLSIEKMVEIKEWVEGPGILLSVGANEAHRLDEYVLRTRAMAIDITEYQHGEADHLIGHLAMFEWQGDAILLDGTRYNPWKKGTPIPLHEGIIVSGGPEDETGLKSFDALDDLFDAIG